MLKDIPGIFKDNDDSDEGNENEDATGENKSEDNQPPKKKGRWGNLLYSLENYMIGAQKNSQLLCCIS